MSVALALPLSPAASIQPRTPLSPTASPASAQHDSSPMDIITNTANTTPTNTVTTTTNADGTVKRKASRRANTAERRATHNAVERQRRETLNGRFLDLAALLPNLATVRRPSKSAIVNSSIALVHSQRRARAAAGRELRSLEAESDALRREVNEWRARSGALPPLQQPVRTPEFIALLSASLDEEDGGAAAEEEERRAYALAREEEDDDDEGWGRDAPTRRDSFSFARGAREGYVAGAGTTTAAPAVDLSALSEHVRVHAQPASHHSVPVPMPLPMMDSEKLAQWNAQLQYALAAAQQQQQQQRVPAHSPHDEWTRHAHAALFAQTQTHVGQGGQFDAGDMFASFAPTRQTTSTFAYVPPALTAGAGSAGSFVGTTPPGTGATFSAASPPSTGFVSTPPTTGDVDEHSGTESTHGSPGSTGSDGHSFGYRRPGLVGARSAGHVPQQQQHQWTAGGGGGQFAAMGLFI